MTDKVFINSICGRCAHVDVCSSIKDNRKKCGSYLEKRPHGDWEKYGDTIEAYDIEGHKTWGQKRRCTKCGFIKTYIEDFGIYPFCPNCSALMWKEGDPNEIQSNG